MVYEAFSIDAVTLEFPPLFGVYMIVSPNLAVLLLRFPFSAVIFKSTGFRRFLSYGVVVLVLESYAHIVNVTLDVSDMFIVSGVAVAFKKSHLLHLPIPESSL